MRINPDDSLLRISEKWPGSISFLVGNGFPQMGDEDKRRSFGARISLRQALAMKNIDVESFLQRMEEWDLREVRNDDRHAVQVMGLLPCPVRIPMEEDFSSYCDENDIKIATEFQAASVGASWIAEHVGGLEDIEDFPDIFISAGFETFFDPEGIGRFREHFADRSGRKDINRSFEGLGLSDPEGCYTMIAVVPAVFLVNTTELGEDEIPQSWEDILDPRFEQRVSLPVGDFDLFSGILLQIRKLYGDDGVRRLGRSLAVSLHPAQMVRIGNRPKAPLVTIMPYFFTRMAREGSPMQAVWPSDGAIISPIFLLTKASGKEQSREVIEYFTSARCGEILAHKGLFPSTCPGVDNGLDSNRRFLWLGWDWISSHDVAEEIRICERLFEEGRQI